MSISTNNVCLWNDIRNLYSTTRTQINRFKTTTINTPDQPVQMKPGFVKELSDYLQTIKSNYYIRTKAKYTIPEVSDVSKDQIIYPVQFQSIQTILNTLSGICVHDSPNYTDRNSKDLANEGGYVELRCPGSN